jgi:translocation and assembly module TamB
VADVDLMRFGRTLDVEFLRAPRLAGRLSGRVKTDGRVDADRPVELNASGLIGDASLFGGRLEEVAFDGRLANDRLWTSLRGSFKGIDPRRVEIEGLAVEGALNGAVDVEVETPIAQASAEDLRVRGLVRLDSSQIHGFTIDRALVRGAWRGRDAEIENLEVEGAGVSLAATGVLGAAPDAESQLAFSASSKDLSPVGAHVGRPIAGALSIDGRLEGPPRDLLATTAVEGEEVRYGELVRVGAIRGRFHARIPDFDPSQAQARLNADASKLAVRGIDASAATLDLMWDGRRLTARTIVDRGARRNVITAAFTPDFAARAASIDTLILGPEGADPWRLSDGVEARLAYGAHGLTASNVELHRGASLIRLDGAPDAPEGLRLRAQQVDLARLGPLLEQPAIEGLLDADVTARNGSDGLRAEGRLDIRAGLLRGLRFESFGADFSTSGRRLTFDAELRAAPSARLLAKGSAPFAFFGVGEADAAEPIELRIESEPIDLAIVGAMTNAVQELSGLVQASIALGGTLGSPEATGRITASKGAFTVALTGAQYTDLEAALVFEPGRARVERASLRDRNGGALDASGALAMSGAAIVGLDVTAAARKLTILSNALGQIVLDADVTLTGSLDAPVAAGEVTLLSGRLDVDTVMRRLGAGPYATTPIDAGRPAGDPAPAQPGAASGPTPAEPRAARSLADRLRVDIAVRIPDNFVLRGNNVRVGDSPIGLGRVNLTIGGDFRLVKAPAQEMVLAGELVTVRGTYAFRGRQFTIQRDGRIRFGGDPTDPALDIVAERDISGVLARVALGGSARRPSLSLSSDPPLDEADILSLIVFNRPINELGTGDRESIARQAGEIASGFVLSPLTATLGETLRLDVFEITTSPDAGGSPTVTLGDQIGERLFLKFSQQFGAQDFSEFALEYQVSRLLRLQAAFAEGAGTANRSFTRRVERIGIDVVLIFSY